MAKFVGGLREVALTKESVRGTAESPASGDFIRHDAHSIKPMAPVAEHTGANGTIHGLQDSTVVKESTEGSIPFVLTDTDLGTVGNLIMGQAPTSSGVGPYTHDWTVSQGNQHVSYTLNYTDPTTGDVAAALGMLDQFTMNVVPDSYVTAELAMKAGKTSSATFTPSYSATPDYFEPKNLTAKFATNYAGLGAASEIKVSEFNITVSKNTDYYWVDGSTEPEDILNQRMIISGDIQLMYDTTTYRDLSLAGTKQAMSFNMTSGDYQLTIELPLADLRDWDDQPDNDSYTQQRLTFNATGRDETNGLIVMQAVDDSATH